MFGTASLQISIVANTLLPQLSLCGCVVVVCGFCWEPASRWDHAKDFSFSAFIAGCAALQSLNYTAVIFFGALCK